MNSEKHLLAYTVKELKTSKTKTATLAALFSAIPIALANPAQALEVQVSPSSPKLGESFSVTVTLDNPAGGGDVTVVNGDETYQAYPVSENKYRALIPTTPLEKAGTRTFRINGGGETKNITVSVAPRKFPVQRITLPPGKAGVKATALELRRAKEFREVRSPEKFWSGPFLKPNEGRVSTLFGVRRYYNGVFANDYYHRGLDYAGAAGSTVIAPAAGRVVLVGRESEGFRVHGNVIGVDHGQGVASIFMHLKSINVKEGEFVKAGQKIGTVGATGASTGAHLHWGLYVNGKSVDPTPWRTAGVE